MKKLRFIIASIILLAHCPCYPWGSQTHKLITRLAIENLPEKLEKVHVKNLSELEKMSIKPDADARKNPKKRHEHYIDIEKLDPAYLRRLQYEIKKKTSIKKFDFRYFSNRTFPYPEKQIDSLLKKLPPSIKEFKQKYRPAEIDQIGSGLYQIKINFNQLAHAYKSNNQDAIIRSIGHLSHFVADMHQPFHTSANYKGQYTANRTLASGLNKNIHSRYETGLPKKFSAIVEREVRSRMRPARKIAPDKIIPAMVDQMRRENKLTGKIINADNSYFKKYPAKKVDWNRYYGFMYDEVGNEMNKQIADAANLLGDLVLTASSSADQRK